MQRNVCETPEPAEPDRPSALKAAGPGAITLTPSLGSDPLSSPYHPAICTSVRVGAALAFTTATESFPCATLGG